MKFILTYCVTIIVAAAAGIVFDFSCEEALPQRPMKLEELQSYFDQGNTPAYVKQITCVYEDGDSDCPYLLVRLVSPDCIGKVSVQELGNVPAGLAELNLGSGDMIVRHLTIFLNYSIWKSVDFKIRRPSQLNVFAKNYVKNGKRTKLFSDGELRLMSMRNAKYPMAFSQPGPQWCSGTSRQECRKRAPGSAIAPNSAGDSR